MFLGVFKMSNIFETTEEIYRRLLKESPKKTVWYFDRRYNLSRIDNNLQNFLAIENELWTEIIDESRESFTLERQEKTRKFIRKTIMWSNRGFIKEGFKK